MACCKDSSTFTSLARNSKEKLSAMIVLVFKHCVESHIHLDAEVRLSLNCLLPYQADASYLCPFTELSPFFYRPACLESYS
jgi:hypothetical protein